MNYFRTDQERGVLGDEVLARKNVFEAKAALAMPLWERFAVFHPSFLQKVSARATEEAQDIALRGRRDAGMQRGRQLADWLFVKYPGLMTGGWDEPVAPPEIESERARLFPLGSPSDLRTSNLMVRWLEHVTGALREKMLPGLPPDFLVALDDALAELNRLLAELKDEEVETEQAISVVQEARDEWDRLCDGLKRVCDGLLHADGRDDELTTLFPKGLVRGTGTTVGKPGTSEAEVEAEPEVEPA